MVWLSAMSAEARSLKPSREAIDQVRAHPRFPDAVRHLSTGFIAQFKGNRIVNALFNDRGRLLINWLALYLHWSRSVDDPNSGLTAGRLKALCIEHRCCSGGRAEAMLALMRMFGYVVPAQEPADRRLRLLFAADKLVDAQIERWRSYFGGMAMVLEDGQAALDALDRAPFRPVFTRELIDHDFIDLVVDFVPEIRLFCERTGGWLIMFTLCISGSPDDSVPPRGPVNVSISELARRFGVSRPHVRKLLNDAVAGGFLARAGDNGEAFLLLQPFHDAVEDTIATQFLLYTEFAGRALRKIGRD